MKNEEYVSSSSIDNPPKESDDEGQVELIPKQSDEERTTEELTKEVGYERNFEVDLTLKLKSGKTYTIPILQGSYPNVRIEDLLKMALESRRTKNVIQAVLDLPQPKHVNGHTERF